MAADRRHLLHVFATFGRGGPQVRFAQITARCPEGWRHTVVSMDGRTDALEGCRGEVALAERPAERAFLASARAFKGLVRAQAPDLVCTYNWGAIEAVAGANAARVPVVHHEEGFGPEELAARKRRRNWMRRLLLRPTAAVVVPSQVLQRIALREWGVRKRKLVLLPNGVDLERFHPAASRADGPLTFGTVGGLRPEKDQANLLEAFARVRQGGVDARLRIVGDGPTAGELRQRAEALGVAGDVTWDGAVVDPSAAYRALDVFVLPSQTEQMPLCLLEAMGTGLPVVATDVGDVRVILAEANRRYVVPAEDPVALAAAMTSLAGDAHLRAALGLANRERAASVYELGACMDAYVSVYASAMRK